MDSMDKYYNMSMVDVAYELMSKKKSAVNFFKLWEEVCQMKKFDDEQKEDKESLFYTNITLDGRFITVGENAWDLRSRHKFSDVHIDMNDIYADEEETEELEGMSILRLKMIIIKQNESFAFCLECFKNYC